MMALAQMVVAGDGVPANFDEAIGLINRVIAMGGDAAQPAWAHLGDFYRLPLEQRDPAKAIDAYQKAISAGNAHAKVSLAAIYGSGDGVAADFEKAKSLLQDA